MSNKNVYLELMDKCDMFKFRNNDLNYYLNIIVLINPFLSELKSNIKECEKYHNIIDKLIKQVEIYIDRNPKQASKNIEEFALSLNTIIYLS